MSPDLRSIITAMAGLFGSILAEKLSAGEAIVVKDVALSSEIWPDIGTFFAENGMASGVAVPCSEQGRLRAAVLLLSREPRSWNEFDISFAKKVLARVSHWVVRKRAIERERLLRREVDHRARNLLAVVQSLINLTKASSVEDFRSRLRARLNAYARTHDLVAGARWQNLQLDRLLAEEIAPFASGMGEIVTEGPDVQIGPSTAHSLGLILHELLTNAAKHGALSPSGGTVLIRWHLSERRSLIIDWIENCRSMIATRMPENETDAVGGFGSFLMRQVVENQLKGKLVRRMEASGLTLSLEIPLGARRSDEGGLVYQRPGRSGQGGTARIMIVEDEAMVALDLEAQVSDLGYQIFGVFSTLDDALNALADRLPDIALLDGNLGGTDSVPVAEILNGKGVPVVFLTGYDSFRELPEGLANSKILTKPVSTDDLESTISALAQALSAERGTSPSG